MKYNCGLSVVSSQSSVEKIMPTCDPVEYLVETVSINNVGSSSTLSQMRKPKHIAYSFHLYFSIRWHKKLKMVWAFLFYIVYAMGLIDFTKGFIFNIHTYIHFQYTSLVNFYDKIKD